MGNISVQEAKDLALFLNQQNLPILATSSRRTSHDSVNSFKINLDVPNHFHEHNKGEQNPYGGMLALSDYLVVTADSVGMISEACSTGRPVYIYESETKPKFRKFHEELYKRGLAKPLTDEVFEKWQYEPLRTRDFILEKIREDIGQQ